MFKRLFPFILGSALYACQPSEIAPIKTPLPACGKSVLMGYADKSSYTTGETIDVYLQSSTDLQCGLGFYDVKGNLVFSSDVSLYKQAIASPQPWEYGFSFSIFSRILLPTTLASGIYFIEGQIPIVVKSPSPADVTVVYPSNTIAAYNPSGGKSLYGFNSTGNIASHIVSFFRPLNDQSELARCNDCLKWFPSLSDFSINYISDADLRDYSSFGASKVLVIAGHSEYWTRAARENFDQYIKSGGNSVLLSGNSMWWHVRYSDNGSQLICYRDSKLDPESNPLMKTIIWKDPTLNLSIVKSIGADFDGGGYGLRADNGWDGYKIVNPASPLLEGLNLKQGDILSAPSDECDGAPIKGFDVNGYPILDNQYNFDKYELIGFDKGTRGGLETYPTFIALRATPTSGIVINMGSNDWCSSSCIGHPVAGNPLKAITKNAIRKLVNGSPVFSN
jgi:hypothetical protein